MQALQLPAPRGWIWLAEGFRLFRRNPAYVTFLVFSYWLLLVLINVFPYIGPLAVSVCMPPLSMSVMNGCRLLDRNQPPDLGMALSGFRDNLPPLLVLGAIYFAGTLAILAVASAIDGGLLLQLMMGGRRADPEALQDPQLMLAVQVSLLLLVPLMMAFWFAPLLTAWHGMSPAKALFFSFVACWRNWRPFLAYGLAVFVWSALLPGLVLGVAAAMSPSLFKIATAAVMMPIVFVLVPSMFASFYVSYREVFAAPEAAPDMPAADA